MGHNVAFFPKDTMYRLKFTDATNDPCLISIYMLQITKESHLSTLSSATSIKKTTSAREPRIFKTPHPPLETCGQLALTAQPSEINLYRANTGTYLADAWNTVLQLPRCLESVKVLCGRTSPPRLPYLFLRESLTYWRSLARVAQLTPVSLPVRGPKGCTRLYFNLFIKIKEQKN